MNPDAILRRGRRPAPVLWQQAWARINAGKRRHGKANANPWWVGHRFGAVWAPPPKCVRAP
jgi:hypothetical protein